MTDFSRTLRESHSLLWRVSLKFANINTDLKKRKLNKTDIIGWLLENVELLHLEKHSFCYLYSEAQHRSAQQIYLTAAHQGNNGKTVDIDSMVYLLCIEKVL